MKAPMCEVRRLLGGPCQASVPEIQLGLKKIAATHAVSPQHLKNAWRALVAKW
jgi:hypothetical protein